MLYDPKIRENILRNARNADFRDMIDYLKDPRYSNEEKLATLSNVREINKLDKAAGAFGTERKNQQTMLDYGYIPPLEVKPQGKPVQMPVVISSDMARNQFDVNLKRLQGFESQFQNSQSTSVAAPEKPNLRNVI